MQAKFIELYILNKKYFWRNKPISLLIDHLLSVLSGWTNDLMFLRYLWNINAHK